MSDAFEPRSAHWRRFRPFASFLVSLRFLTRLPVPFVRTVDPPRLRDSMAMFPVVGLLVGAITGGALILAGAALSIAPRKPSPNAATKAGIDHS